MQGGDVNVNFRIEFSKSGKTVEWDEQFQNILELAESNGVPIPSDCRMGVCGTCKTKLLSGEVEMETEEGLNEDDKAQKMILLCVAVPKSDLKLDA
jgi:ferredoxin